MLERWLNKSHGLELLPDINQGRRNNENGIMYFSQLLVLKQYNGTLTEEDKALFNEVCLNLRAWHKNGDRAMGVFDRGQNESLNQEGHVRKISHDNLTAISRTSNDLGLDFHKAIAKNYISNQSRFDNAQLDSPRWLLKSHDGKTTTSCQIHPRDTFYWLYMGGYKKTAMLFYPMFILANLLTCFGKLSETSGKNLIWTRLLGRKELPLKMLWGVCNYILKKRYGTDNWIKETCAIYYHQSEENPIRIEAEKLT
mgnify:CR=1 FL=1